MAWEEKAAKRWPPGIRPTTNTCFEGLIRGSITKDDYEKVACLYRSNHPFLSQFRLMSSGGNAEEAMQIGRLFRRYLITSWAPINMGQRFVLPSPSSQADLQQTKALCNGGSECVCASACALIWFGASERHGTVGLHRPRINEPEYRALPPAEASAVYRTVLDRIAQYLDAMEVPRPLIETMVSTSSSEVRWVDADRDGLNHVPSIAEWLDASCGSFTSKENETMLDLMGKLSNRSQQEELLFRLLLDKSQKKAQCEHVLLSNHRSRLALP
jgi:hypothetical protein